MKKVSVVSSLLALLLVVGCSHKLDDKTVAGDVGAGARAVQNAPVSTEMVKEKEIPAPVEEKHEEPKPIVEEKPSIASGTVIGSIYFDFDKYEVKEDEQDVLDESIQKAKENHMQVLLEGNTDEFGSSEYNQALGVKRALSVKNAMVVKGLEKEMVKTISFGETKPKCTQKSKECYQENRRVDIKLVK
ncbi:outer membrane protein Omp18 [Helicobacter cetorum]|uniref:Peptidoglycan-associated lipoprotein n=1 Tax=Helicobacter cetorum (strain ATCC BAA-540 / CCUG 52418 / MIT 99-5656) TaxID=1163745 RepID=I0EU35_HELCM|nr:OmpA family protein [Helicobacter cetorum]AFI06454.1 peptidoglycan-associated lipoprotein precursor [Helicobacter cetorum MIT 99-5656]